MIGIRPLKMEHSVSETSTCKIQTQGNYPEESIQHSEQGECLKSRTLYSYHNCIKVALPEDEPSGSNHVEDLKNLLKNVKNKNTNLGNCVSLVYIG